MKLSNGIEMPMEGFGVFQVTDPDVCEQTVLDAIETGYRLIDTASSYQNEEAVGRAIQKSEVPRGTFITTKAYIQQMGYDKTMQAFEESLQKLGLDYLDLYLIHMPFGDYYGSWRAMEELYKAGRIRAIGVCNFMPDRLLDLCYNAQVIPQVNQIERHPHYQRPEDLQIMKELGVQPQA
ncbi:MAG: aldo/keto reductase [[Clostridium] scindens]